jgi:hypothetical protein
VEALHCPLGYGTAIVESLLEVRGPRTIIRFNTRFGSREGRRGREERGFQQLGAAKI